MASLVPSMEGPGAARDRAFERLYQQYAQDVYRYTLALLRNPADAEDVTQTTFMNAYRAFKRGDHIEKPHNWLIRIAHNAARTKYARSLRRVQEVPLDESVTQLPVPEEDKPNVQDVLDALGELPFNQRAALVMRELEGRSYNEIADTLGVSQSAVEALIFRARRSLRLSRKALHGLMVIQLPVSLASFFEGPGGAVAGGGALVGGGLLLKAAVVMAVSAVAAGVGYKSVEAKSTHTAPPRGKIHPFALHIGAEAQLVRAARIAATNLAGGGAAKAGTRVKPDGDGGKSDTAAGTAAAAQLASDPPGAGQSQAAGTAVDTVASTVASAPVQLPVKPPSVPTTQAPSVPVTVPQLPTVPQVPQPPPPPPLPKIP